MLDIYCPQCGETTEALYEGYCEECCENNQRELDDHNASFDRWQAMSDQERGDKIRQASRRGSGLV